MKVRKRSGNPESTSTRLKGKDRKRERPTEEDALGIVKGLSNVEVRREDHRSKPAGVILSETDGGIIAMLCPFHAAKAGKWDELTLQTRAASCEDCQRLTLAINKAAQKKKKEEEDDDRRTEDNRG